MRLSEIKINKRVHARVAWNALIAHLDSKQKIPTILIDSLSDFNFNDHYGHHNAGHTNLFCRSKTGG